MMKRPLMLAGAVAALFATPGNAALQQGAHVPSLVTQGALDGRPFPFNLQQALREGPVVLYFFPKANTPGCNLEAKAFAEKIDEFERAGAQVIAVRKPARQDHGVSASQVGVLVPDQRGRLPQHMCSGVVGVLIAVGCGELEDGEIHAPTYSMVKW